MPTNDLLSSEIFERRVETTRWLEFANFIDEILYNLDLEKKKNADALPYFSNLVNDIILHCTSPFPRLVACELLPFGDPSTSHNVGLDTLGNIFIHQREQTELIRRLVSALIAIDTDAGFDLDELQNSVFRVYRGPDANPEEITDLFQVAVQLQQDGQSLVHIDYISEYSTFPNLELLPGDCIFRRQSSSRIGNPFRDFGHTGIYLGCVNPDTDLYDINNHEIIHVINAKPACQHQTLKDFIYPGGKEEEFWGFYQADLTKNERNSLIANALSYKNKCTYNFFGKYKTPPSFRCDGFVEHLYEAISPSRNPLNYRSGLFEDDLWKTMNPHALRNCLVRKFDLPGNVKP